MQVLEGRGVSQTLRGACVGRDGELGGCGFVVTLGRKVPSCMALLCPGLELQRDSRHMGRGCCLCSSHSHCPCGPNQNRLFLGPGQG